MATYFDIDNPGHVALILPVELRKASELATVVDTVEYDLLNRFTRRLTTAIATERYPDAVAIGDNLDRFVLLKGYAVALVDADSGFAEAFKRTIAHVAAWRLQYLRREPHVHSQHTTEGKFVRYTDDSKSPFPPDWKQYLYEYDLSEPTAYL